NRYTISKNFPDREEAGTPNIVGTIGLGAALYALHKVGMKVIAEDETRLINYALEKMSAVNDLIIYGETDPSLCQRTGAISFNLRNFDHGLTAAVLNDYFNLSVRNECFCAHPYVREMVMLSLAEEAEHLSDAELERLAELHKGMVRASFGIYNTEMDVDALVAALHHISANREHYQPLYHRVSSGDYVHNTFTFEHEQLFSVRRVVEQFFNR
ncbi:MAG: aminotransferase class V-fold PLP-dependent enzyme, partial [candidate division KSB1 bacterium]